MQDIDEIFNSNLTGRKKETSNIKSSMEYVYPKIKAKLEYGFSLNEVYNEIIKKLDIFQINKRTISFNTFLKYYYECSGKSKRPKADELKAVTPKAIDKPLESKTEIDLFSNELSPAGKKLLADFSGPIGNKMYVSKAQKDLVLSKVESLGLGDKSHPDIVALSTYPIRGQ
ncbi:hypothetical protein [Azonexus sp. R2A61]|uniref:hypothetical protein n=1 Tax=Azonexus sp. R2A61 TaxID=2744443 RepID=UPI001F3271AE|nr:hypothetical protein [Azonexus sp. R2A61]